jgi:peptidoglycan hydrolase CwlO-like protein
MEEIKDLKAQAYDALAAIEFWQKKLAELNQKIAELQNKLQEG